MNKNEMTAEELAKKINESIEALKNQVHEAVTKEELQKIEEKLNNLSTDVKDANKTMFDALKEDIANLKDSINGPKVGEELKGYLTDVIKENHAEIVKAVKEKKSIEFRFKAAATHMTNNGTVTNIAGLSFPTNDNFQVSNDIAVIRIPENFILSVIKNRSVGQDSIPEQIIKKQQVPTEGAAALTAEGAVKPLIQYKWQNTATSRKKYAGRVEWTEEFAMDYKKLVPEIIRMLERDVLTAWQDGLMSIIDTNATSYVSSVMNGTLVNPDNGLAVIAGALQVKGLNYNPNKVYMNPQDVAASVYTQDVNGNFSLKPYIAANGDSIGTMKLVESNKVAVGTAYVGDFTVYDEQHTDFILRVGQYGDQLIENEYTTIGEVFSLLSIAPIDFKAIVKLNLATIKAALTKPTEA